jgi:hypothetical protein
MTQFNLSSNIGILTATTHEELSRLTDHIKSAGAISSSLRPWHTAGLLLPPYLVSIVDTIFDHHLAS